MSEYLRMGDVFPNGVEIVGEDGEYNGWYAVAHVNGPSIDESGDGGFYEKTARYVVHAIAKHDMLVLEVLQLRKTLKNMTAQMDDAELYIQELQERIDQY